MSTVKDAGCAVLLGDPACAVFRAVLGDGVLETFRSVGSGR
jgi:hypothetical protein